MVAITTAIRGLTANKLRSVLTMLGIIIGVGSVIFAYAMTQGSKEALRQSIQKLGTNTLTVIARQQRRGGITMGSEMTNTLSMADGDAILRSCPSVQRVSPGVSRSAQIKYKNKNTNTSISGTGADYPLIGNHAIEEGRYFSKEEVKGLKRVAVIGSTTSKDLFDQESPVNKTIRIKGITFAVVGKLVEKGGMAFRNPDDVVYVPVTTAMRRLFGLESLQSMSVQARSELVMNQAQGEIEELLRRRHNIPTAGNADFMTFNQADITETQNEQQENTSFVVFIMGGLSLLVGGIGIMNIMLVSVTERTREIGIRKAIGAKRRNILSQFVIEATFLSVLGGLMGIPAGMLAGNAIGAAKNWVIVHQPMTVLLAFSFSLVIGLFFGLYPAFKASKLNPIDALRYE